MEGFDCVNLLNGRTSFFCLGDCDSCDFSGDCSLCVHYDECDFNSHDTRCSDMNY